MLKRLLLSCVLLVAGFVAGIVVTGRVPIASDSRAEMPRAGSGEAPPAQAERPAAPVTAAAIGGPDFTRIAGQAVKGVANISSLQVVRTSNSPFANDPFFRYFFGDDDSFGPRDRRSLSLGSGVVVSADGYVITNNHVIGENMQEITVALADKREIKGKVIGTDPATDIALLKINIGELPVVPWGDSSRLKVGEWVLAIGSPFQLNRTVTAGIVSATGRQNVGFADYEDFIQTDAAINPGNSGGALINSRGELIGINTGIFSQSGGYQGIGFAVPSNLARHVVDELRKYGTVQRGTIDFRVDRLTPDLADEVGVASTRGALVTRMTRNSASYDAGQATSSSHSTVRRSTTCRS
jgi:serine protease Do